MIDSDRNRPGESDDGHPSRYELIERLEAIVNSAREAIITTDAKGVIQSFNPAAETMFGYTASDACGRGVDLLMPSRHGADHQSYVDRYLQVDSPLNERARELVGRRHDGALFRMDLSVSQVDHLGLFTLIVRDVTERNDLHRKVLAAATEEQQRIGRELHDDVQQQLAALGMMAESLSQSLDSVEAGTTSSEGLAELRQRIERLVQGLSTVGSRVQAIARGLAPVEIEPDGLPAALAALARSIDDAYEPRCRLRCDVDARAPDTFSATHLYRIAQESITNALKHGNPQTVDVSLNRQDNVLILTVADDGTGIGVDADRPNATGLGIMRYRAGVIGADLNISPNAAGGTSVTCRLWT